MSDGNPSEFFVWRPVVSRRSVSENELGGGVALIIRTKRAKPAMPEGSISQWIVAARAGDAAAIQKIWNRYYAQLVRSSHKELTRFQRNQISGEDAAGTALFQLLSGLRRGLFPNLTDRDSLWSVLWTIMERRLIDEKRKLGRRRRKEVGASALRPGAASTSGRSELRNPFDQFPVDDVTPEFLVILRQLMESLTQALRQVAELVLAGHTGREIARKLDCSEKTVQRRLKLIRHHWEKEL